MNKTGVSPRRWFSSRWPGVMFLALGVVASSLAPAVHPPTGLAAGEAGTWVDMNAAPLSARLGHTAVWTGTEMLVWGGMINNTYCGSTFFADGARSKPDGGHDDHTHAAQRSAGTCFRPARQSARTSAGTSLNTARDAWWDDDQVIQVAQHGHEIGYQIEWTQRIGDDAGRHQPCEPRRVWIADSQL